MIFSSDCICGNNLCPLISKGFRPYACSKKKFWRYSFLQGKVVVLEGNIGSGKSSSAKEMARILQDEYGIPAIYIPEFVDLELLNLFIKDMKTYAYVFQLFMLEKRAENYRKAIELARLGHVVIMDRMMYGDLAFALHHFEQGNMTPEQFDNYRNRMASFQFNDPALTIYLETTPSCSANRAKKRSRKGETGYDIKYFEAIQKAYEKVLKQYKGNILYINYEEDLLIEELTPRVEDILEECTRFLFSPPA